MKKLIQLCFLASLCLIGSTTTAQVADSPGADFLHRSSPHVSPDPGDTHRGGEIRSDTLPEKNGLVDHSGIQRQEDGSPSAHMGINQGTILLYIQAKTEHPLQRLRVTFLEAPLDENAAAPNFREVRNDFRPGTIWDGGFGAEWSRVSIEAKQAGLLSVYVDESRMIDQFLAFPGDSLQLFINLDKGEKVFAGPDYELAEFQDRAEKLLTRIQKEEGMGIHVREGEDLFGSEESKKQFGLAQQEFGPKVLLVPIDIPEMIMDWKKETRQPRYFLELDHLLLFYRNRIDPGILSFLRQELRAAYYIQQVGRLQTVLGYAKESESQRSLVRNALQEILPEFQVVPAESATLPPPERQIGLHYKILQIQTKLEQQPMISLIDEYSDQVFRDYLLARHIFQRLKFGNISPRALQDLAASVHSPYLKTQIQQQVDAVQPQAKVADFAFQDKSGNTYTLEDFKGKTVLVNTYFTGCSASASYYKKVLSRIAKEFEGEDDLVLVSLSADRETGRWEKGNASGLYNSAGWLRLHTDGRGYSHPFFRNYLISSAPRPLLIDPEGNLISITELYTDPNHLRELIVQSLPPNPNRHVQ